MKLHAYRYSLSALAGAALLAGSLAAHANSSYERLEYQGQATAEHGDAFRSATLKSIFGAQARSGPARLLVCGDSEPDAGEECDDGNTTPGDGCSATCTIEPGFDCSAAVAGMLTENILVDGSFENGNAGGEWTAITHSLFGPNLICGDSCFGAPFAAAPDGSTTSGNYVLIAGGSFSSSSTGSAVHAAVAIPADALTLEFQWATLASGPANDPCAGPTDGLALHIGGTGGTGGTQVWSNTDGGPCTNQNPYARVVIDLSTVPNGVGDIRGTTTEFYFTASATGIPPTVDLTNVMLDDVAIFVPATPPVPPVPSVCTAVVCGDGAFPQFSAAGSEECDDGNTTPGDGCSATCTVEQPDFICDDPEPAAASGNDVADGGLEDGSPNPNWVETGTQFEPICSQAFCGAALANDGVFYAWFGGSSMPNAQTLTQDVVISTTATDLTFDLLVGICDSANDSLTVEIDGTEIYRYDCTADTATYQPQSASIAAFADGLSHTLQFIGNTVATNLGNSNFFVDNIAIEDNVAFPGAPGSCFELDPACDTIEQFEGTFPPAGWTVINTGDDPLDGWGRSDDGICLSQNATTTDPGNNVTGGGGLAACADSDATGQIDIDGGAPAPDEMSTYLCSPALDLSQVTDPVFSFLVNYQAADNDFNDNGTPMDPSDDFDDDFLQVLVGDLPPSSLTVQNYTNLGNVFDHLDGSLALSEEAALSANLGDQNALTAAHVCFHYRGTYAWFAQIDNAGLRGSACVAPPDSDGDGVPDSIDNCKNFANADQRDTDGDGHGNRCDADLNNDCIVNPIDLGIFRGRFFTADPDADLTGDGIVNPIDLGIFRSLFFQPPGESDVGILGCATGP